MTKYITNVINNPPNPLFKLGEEDLSPTYSSYISFFIDIKYLDILKYEPLIPNEFWTGYKPSHNKFFLPVIWKTRNIELYNSPYYIACSLFDEFQSTVNNILKNHEFNKELMGIINE